MLEITSHLDSKNSSHSSRHPMEVGELGPKGVLHSAPTIYMFRVFPREENIKWIIRSLQIFEGPLGNGHCWEFCNILLIQFNLLPVLCLPDTVYGAGRDKNKYEKPCPITMRG